MKKRFLTIIIFITVLVSSGYAQILVFHTIQKDDNGKLLSWYSPNHGSSYDHILNLVWNFWQNIDTCCGGNKGYMVDHSYNSPPSGNKIGGDQFAMMLSSWALYYAYTGDTNLIKDMVYIADTYLANSLSDPSDAWPNLPYPCNYTNTLSAVYDGDFLMGAGVTQPDKAASFAAELITLYKITNNNSYLQAAINIANTLAAKVQPGHASTPPFPFRINTQTGSAVSWLYSANMTPELRLFEELSKMNQGNTVQYDTAYAMVKRWIKQYPIHTNNWGSFFENIIIPSNTEINAVTMAWYILEHPDWGSTWQQDARGILDWTLSTLGSNAYDSLGVTAIYEQSVDLKEGGSHTSRLASVELLYSELTGDTSRRDQAIRQLNWSTYLVDFDGRCKFSPQEGSAWYTDGYGDFARHFVRAMAYDPALAPDSSNHLLSSSSVVSWIKYQPQEIHYTTFDNSSIETLRLTSKPLQVKADGEQLHELSSLNAEGFTWTSYALGGVLKVRHDSGSSIDILWTPSAISEYKNEVELKLYPNPSDGQLILAIRGATEQQSFLRIYNIAGKLVYEECIADRSPEFKEEIDLTTLAKGMYYLKVESGDSVTVKKIAVQ